MTPYLCRHGHYATEHWCDDHADHALPAGPPLHEQADRDGDNVPSDRVRAYAEAIDNAVLPARLRAVMAVADREQAALRAEVERQATLLSAINDCHLDPARAILQADKIAGAAILRAEKAEATIARVELLLMIGPLIPADALRAALRGPEPTEDRAAALAEAIRADNEQVRADDFQKWLNRPQPTEEPS